MSIPFLQSLADRFKTPPPLPQWLVDEGQARVVLFLNHVIGQEKTACERLQRKKGSVVHVKWGLFAMYLAVTPAGLLERVGEDTSPDLVLTMPLDAPLQMARAAFDGKPPAVKIEGDVQLAAEVGWLAENLRWDVEEDLSRVIGDAPAHTLVQTVRRVVTSLRELVKNSFPPPAGEG